ncbi:hypothetical protein M9H77_06905 [Catharanthus roseus]|uniref:Uncharacterized protein n=1 Tax=Catharanthus roseus TaxID=4058 RepID=A0ACC0BTG7_CATRO|nr:hypothetical protein M9H77_06905 [Catharanthus roseus]
MARPKNYNKLVSKTVKEMMIEKRTLTCRRGVNTASEKTIPRLKRRRAAARNNEPCRGAGEFIANFIAWKSALITSSFSIFYPYKKPFPWSPPSSPKAATRKLDKGVTFRVNVVEQRGSKTPTYVNIDALNNSEDIKSNRKEAEYEKFEDKYNFLHTTWKELSKDYIVIKAENVKLLEENSQVNSMCQKLKQDLRQTMTQYETTVGKLEEAEKYMEKLNNGKIKLHEILESGKSFGDLTSLGYVNSVTSNLTQQKSIKEIAAGLMKIKLSNAEKKSFFGRIKPRKPPPI